MLSIVHYRKPCTIVFSRRLLTLTTLALIAVVFLGIFSAGGTERAPLAGLTIVLDPGHGDHDRGVCHFPSDLIEKEINLDVAKIIQAGLEAVGARVILTRSDDTFLGLSERAELANRVGADLFLSIHTNRIPKHPECFGAQSFYFPDSEPSRRLALSLQEELLKADPANYRKALPGNYRVLRVSTMPAALVEIGFLTNARDRSLIATEEYRRAVSAAVVAGVIRFVQGEAPLSRQTTTGTAVTSTAIG